MITLTTRQYHPINPIIFTKSKPEVIKGINNGEKLADFNFKTIGGILKFFSSKECKKIKTLNLSGFENISKEDVKSLGKFPNLKKLLLTNCKIQNVIHDIQELDLLKHLDLENTDLRFLHNLPFPKLESINLSGTELQNLNGILTLINLKEVVLLNCKNLKDITSFQYLTSVESLKIKGCHKSLNFDSLPNLNLKTFENDFSKPVSLKRKDFSPPLSLINDQETKNKDNPLKKRRKLNTGEPKGI